MINIREYLKRNFMYLIFLFLGLTVTGMIKGFNVVIISIFFLALFATTCYSIVGIYNLIRGEKGKGLIWWSLLSILLGVVVKFKYDTQLLLKIVTMACIISVIIIVYINTSSKKNR